MTYQKQYIIATIFALVAAVSLMTHSDYLYALQEQSLFVKGHTFMLTALHHNGGLWTWIGCYLTQFFYYPWLGTLMLILIWLLTFFCLVDALRLKGYWTAIALLPSAIQLFSVLSLGYWLYYCKQPGFAFAQAVSIFAGSFLAFAANRAVSYILGRSTRKQVTAKVQQAIYVLCTAVALLCVCPVFKVYAWTLPDKTFHAEMKMYRAIDECRWDDVLDEAKNYEQPTNLMVMYKNIALMHTNRLTDMFKTNNCGTLPNTPDSLKIHISQLAAPMLYYQFGQTNYAYRWAIENSVEYGMTINNLKILTRCAIINQEFDVARKYISLLRATAFHAKWANQQEELMYHSSNLMRSEEFQNIAPLLNDDVNQLDTDGGLCEKWLLDHFSDLAYPTSPKLEDVTMCAALWNEDAYSFCIHFYNYVKRHPNASIPPLYQEGAILLCTQEESPIELNGYEFDKFVSQRYNQFVRDYNELAKLGLEGDEIGTRLKQAYGTTYWWYYYFYTDFKVY